MQLFRPMPKCQCGSIKECECNAYNLILDIIEEDKLMQFLPGLNEHFQHVINQVPLIKPLPNVNKAFSMLLKIEK